MRRMQTAVGAATATQSDPLDKVAAAIGAYLDFLGRASSAADQYASILTIVMHGILTHREYEVWSERKRSQSS